MYDRYCCIVISIDILYLYIIFYLLDTCYGSLMDWSSSVMTMGVAVEV